MSAFSLLVALVLTQTPAPDTGELTRSQLLELVRSFGYEVESLPEPAIIAVTSKDASFHIVLSLHAAKEGTELTINRAVGRSEFELPHYVGKEVLQQWKTAHSLEAFRLTSFLDGRVVLESEFGGTGRTEQDLRRNFTKMAAACQQLGAELRPLGGKVKKKLYQMSGAPLDPNVRLTSIHDEDFDILRERLHWGRKVQAGGGKGWMNGAEPHGVPLVFQGIQPSAIITITRMGRATPEWIQRNSSRLAAIEWARVLVQEEFVHAQMTLDLSKGMTVRQLKEEIERFADRVKDWPLK